MILDHWHIFQAFYCFFTFFLLFGFRKYLLFVLGSTRTHLFKRTRRIHQDFFKIYSRLEQSRNVQENGGKQSLFIYFSVNIFFFNFVSGIPSVVVFTSSELEGTRCLRVHTFFLGFNQSNVKLVKCSGNVKCCMFHSNLSSLNGFCGKFLCYSWLFSFSFGFFACIYIL